MKKQNFEEKNEKIRSAFTNLKKQHPECLKKKLELSWSNWVFGLENLEDSAKRLERAGIKFVELHGNHYGPDLGYKFDQTLEILKSHRLNVSGVCGMFSADNDLSSIHPMQRQAAIDYLKREIEFTSKIGGTYLLVVPGAVGRPQPYDSAEFDRSVESLKTIADLFIKYNVKAAIEPIRSAEVSLVHTIADAKKYINAVNHPGIVHINGDVYHMLSEESHIGEAILYAGEQLINLHMADSNRRALGEAFLDLDTVIMSLYLIGFNKEGCFVTPEPLGPMANPYSAMNFKPDPQMLDHLVMQTVSYFREREEVLLNS